MGISVLDEINLVAQSSREKLALLMGQQLESSGNPNAVSNDGSYGPFQILLSAHPGITSGQAMDPAFAVPFAYSTLGYKDAVKQVSDTLWQSDPAQAAAQAAYIAERPAKMYSSDAIQNAYNAVKDKVAANTNSTPVVGGIANAMSGVGSTLQDWRTGINKWSDTAPIIGGASSAADAAGAIKDAGGTVTCGPNSHAIATIPLPVVGPQPICIPNFTIHWDKAIIVVVALVVLFIGINAITKGAPMKAAKMAVL